MDNGPGAPTSRHPPEAASAGCNIEDTERLLAHICGQLYFLICARLKMMDLYPCNSTTMAEEFFFVCVCHS